MRTCNESGPDRSLSDEHVPLSPATDVLDGRQALGASSGHVQWTQFCVRYVHKGYLFEVNVRHG